MVLGGPCFTDSRIRSRVRLGSHCSRRPAFCLRDLLSLEGVSARAAHQAGHQPLYREDPPGDSAPTAASWVWCPHCSQGSILEGERVLWPSAWALRWGLQLSGPGAPTPSKPTLESLHTAPVDFAWASPSQLANSNFRPKSGATSSRKAPAPESVP